MPMTPGLVMNGEMTDPMEPTQPTFGIRTPSLYEPSARFPPVASTTIIAVLSPLRTASIPEEVECSRVESGRRATEVGTCPGCEAYAPPFRGQSGNLVTTYGARSSCFDRLTPFISIGDAFIAHQVKASNGRFGFLGRSKAFLGCHG